MSVSCPLVRGRNETRWRNGKRRLLEKAGTAASRIFLRRQIWQFENKFLPGWFLAGHRSGSSHDRRRRPIARAESSLRLLLFSNQNHFDFGSGLSGCFRASSGTIPMSIHPVVGVRLNTPAQFGAAVPAIEAQRLPAEFTDLPRRLSFGCSVPGLRVPFPGPSRIACSRQREARRRTRCNN